MGGCFAKPGIKPAERAAAMEKYKLSEEEIRKIEEFFYDRASKRKYVTYSGFRTLYASSRFDQEEADMQAVFRTIARPPQLDGRIDFDSFVRLILLCNRGKEVEGASEEDRMRVLFDVMDSDGSESISKPEFQRFLLNFVDDDTATSQMFDKLDSDQSEEIDFQEFSSFCKSNRKVYRKMCLYVFPSG
ncbi:hypothetical protein BOX15_Mlig008368g1 [Macrostomum lignano]|uniref:EF-hand domain-containing protein n=1 Tax=Macrostomum lignano TaxID=282301 RepID=A0A267EJJ5_9PLAT|nr:hypothetical protein BOX15_Mlig008368g1 [Macrostomum lignano]